jgi:leucine-zipper of insertion element IS481
MGLGRYMVDAVVLEGRSPTELARTHGISRSWINELVARFRQGGYPALEPGSRRPRSCPHEVRPEVQTVVLELRHELSAAGYDAGAQTIAHHLVGRVDPVPSVATIWCESDFEGFEFISATPLPVSCPFQPPGRQPR